MSFEVNSPNMNLPIPGVGLTDGPQYATDIDNCLTLIDQHDHSPGNGVQITPSGININSPLQMNANDLTFANRLAMISQLAAFTVGTNNGSLYVVGNDLYYQNFNTGFPVQLTNGNSIVGTAGSISGLPSGTASASFSASTFIFQSATSVAANLDFGSAVLRNNTLSSPSLTLSPPTLSSGYTITLPYLPGSTSFVAIGPTGTMSATIPVAGGITDSNIATGTVTTNKIVTDPVFNGILDSTTITRSRGLNAVVSNTNASDNLAIIRGVVNGNGTILEGEGFSMAHAGTGVYNLTFGVGFSDGPSVIITPNEVAVPSVTASTTYTGSPANVIIRIAAIGGGLVDNGFSFIVIGKRTP